MNFTSQLFTEVQPLVQRIHQHAFNKELAAGSLARETFAFYMQQDSLYLIDFARVFSFLGSKLQRETDIALMLTFAEGALIAERSLHAYYFTEFAIPSPESCGMGKGLACQTYTSYLLEQAAFSPFTVAFTALLPCFWVYREVGRRILTCATPDNPYAKWIETYASEDFSEGVEQAVAFTDKLAEKASSLEREQMKQAFMQATRLEYFFWDGAYQRLAIPLSEYAC